LLDILYKFLLILLYLFSIAVLLVTALGIPGNWILVGIALIIALVTKFTAMNWWYLILCVSLAALGELIESLLGLVLVAKKGGSKMGIFGTFLGGLCGVILGAPYFPPFGSLIFGFVGAFAGAMLGEYVTYKNMDAAMRIGFWAFVGRAAAIVSKVALGCGIVYIIIIRTWF
jgi:uncharacterized protein YqgC (DUF456 family)